MATKALAVQEPPQPTQSDQGRFIKSQAITLKTSAAETSSYTTDDGILVRALRCELKLDVTASTGPTTLDVKVQGSTDGTNWVDLASFAQVGAVATSTKYIVCLGATYMRYVSTIAGTSYTYSISGTYRFG